MSCFGRPSEPVIHAECEHVEVARQDYPVAWREAANGLITQSYVVPLYPRGPAGSEAILDADTEQQPTSGVGSADGEAVREVDQRFALVHPADAGLAVEQPAIGRPAEARRKGRDPIDTLIGCEGSAAKTDECRGIRTDAGSIEHPFDADNKLGPNLPVVADLTAAHETGTAGVEAHPKEIVGQRAGVPGDAQVSADIQASPVIVVV
jgi:hypothetical protein